MSELLMSHRLSVAQTLRPRGRPRRSPAQQAEIRARVIKIAARLFRDEGLPALSMRRIASKARISPMGLYDYFRSKNEIIRAIWERFFSGCFESVENAAAHCEQGARHKLQAACAAYIRYWTNHPDQYRAVFMIEDNIEKQEQYFVRTSPLITRYSIFAALLDEHKCLARSDPEAHRERALALICALNGICHMLVTVGEYPWPAAARLLEPLLRMVD